jgi:nitrate/nitrite transporter NarK
MGKTRIELLDFSPERMPIPHYTWIAFFLTFFVWSDLPSLSTAMSPIQLINRFNP